MKISAPNPDLLNQSLHFNKNPPVIYTYVKNLETLCLFIDIVLACLFFLCICPDFLGKDIKC